jgi:hypothetical protein
MLAGIIVAAPGVLGFLPVKTSEARRRCFVTSIGDLGARARGKSGARCGISALLRRCALLHFPGCKLPEGDHAHP